MKYMFIKRISSIVCLIVCCVSSSNGQDMMTLPEAIEFALQHNIELQSADLNVAYNEQLKKISSDIPKTDIMLMHGQYNSYIKKDNNITVSQTLPFPTVWTSEHALGKARVTGSEMEKAMAKNSVVYRVSSTFYQVLYLQERHVLLAKQDSIYRDLLNAATLRYTTGESNLLEKISAETQAREVVNQYSQNEADIAIQLNELQRLLNASESIQVEGTLMVDPVAASNDADGATNPTLMLMQQRALIAEQQKRVAAARALPDILLGYFNQSLIGPEFINGQEVYYSSRDRFQGFQVGLAIPLWFTPHVAKVKAAGIQQARAIKEVELYTATIDAGLKKAVKENEKAQTSLQYYIDYALPNAAKLITQSIAAFANGETDYTTHLLNLKNALLIEDGYLMALRDYKLTLLTIDYLKGTLH